MGATYSLYFNKWKDWSKFEDRFDAVNGVYAFRLKASFPRLKGESRVVYIGMCNHNPKRNKRPGLWHRLNNYRQDLKGGSARLKLLSQHVGGDDRIEYAYVTCENPRATEKALLQNYFEQHLELPPLNRAG